MLELRRSDLLESAGFVHGFSTRRGGTSEPPFDSLNIGFGVGDHNASVLENLDRVRVLMDCKHLAYANQVHGSAVIDVQSTSLKPGETADAVTTTDGDVAVSVRTADCVPVLLGCTETGRVWAVHVGWRGVANGIISSLGEHYELRHCVAAIGPHICANHFEIGADVAAELEATVPGCTRKSENRITADLSHAVRDQLQAAGVTRHQRVEGCTFGDEEFFSYRRDGRTGRQLAVIRPPACD